ncbi:hydrophobic/amphiphilic exporter-1, HAE1 family [Fictibacillus enclensis]|uniref:Multidrug transporter AcrB n=1 Tax=Fictibacillus enclensis TaxID=1017270 RepID=A0A0V8IZV3_9BACL|nr:efflux RND transporter permease subunit [Fictibacillus enclensis]KSU80293.1 multidrug transporter AcrB [Fictibacillus enclensis]SCC37677.1 hydrophobic/amphiphilic exporter-1, HAE1 family [Fictibacillus enclensis]
MQSITNWAFRNKAPVTLFVIIALIIGAVSYFRLPMEFLPEADNPQVSVVTIGQGYDAGSMTEKVTEPVEQAVSGVKGKSSVLSTTGDGYSQITINFDSKTDMKEAKREVQDAVSSLKFPETVGKPQVSQLNTSMIPVGQVSFTFADGLNKENMEKAKNQLLPLFDSKKSISQASIFGENTSRVEVKLDTKKLKEKNIPVNSVMSVLQGQNASVTAGGATIDGKKSTINVTDNLTSVRALGKLIIPVQAADPKAPPVRLKDVATVKQSKMEDTVLRINGKESLAITVFKENSASAVTAGNDVNDTVSKINKEYPGVKAKTIFTTGEMVENSVNSMMKEVLLGALFATIVILVFLRRVKPTLVTIVSIPLSLAITLLLLWLSGVTLNILTLGGVAVAVGRLVDDSIVVVENIFRRSQGKAFTKENVLAATGEVTRAITSSTLITVAVFLPMGLVNGSLKAFLLPFGLTVTYSLLASLLVALTVVPLMSQGMLKNMKLPAHGEPKRYLNLLKWSLNHKYVPIIVAVGVLVGAVGMYVSLPKGEVNAEDASMVAVNMEFPSNTPTDEIKDRMKTFESKLADLKGYKYLLTQYGVSEDEAKYGSVSSSDVVKYTAIMKEDANADDFIKEVNKAKKEESGVTITASPGTMFGSGTGTSEITYDIQGNDKNELESTSKELMNGIKDVKGVKKVSSNQDKTAPVYTVKVDTEKMNTEQAAHQIASLIQPMPIGTITLDDKTTPVLLDAGINPSKASDLDDLSVQTAQGIQPLSKVADITIENKPSTELHKDGKPYIRISAEVKPDNLSAVAAAIDKKVKKLDLPKGMNLEKGGAAEQQSSDFADLGTTMLASILIVYLIMVITFKTFRAPLAILMTLPLASIGAVLGLLVSGVPADPTALIGGLMLIGIVITNAIVLIDRVKQNEEKMIIRDAIIEACGTRLRPVVMTAVATIFAMLPLLFSHTEDGSLVSKSLAVVVIGGLTGATVLTLVIVPVFYELLHFRKSKRQRVEAAQDTVPLTKNA